MLQEAMKTLEDAEAKAAEIVKEAGKKAEAIQAEAKEKANAMIVDANAGSKTDLAAIAVDQKKLETDLAEEALKEASDEIASLKKRASEREGEEVAVKTRQPAALAPIAALIALCSLSTGINSVSISPFEIYVETNCGISVEGVIGNAGMTSGLICLIA